MPWYLTDVRTLVTAAPGTGSTSLTEAVRRSGAGVDVAALVRSPVRFDPKHATLAQVREAGFGGEVDRVVTGTRNPFDFYVAEWYRTRTRWAAEVTDPDSWVHRVDGMLDRIRRAVDLDFRAWLRHELRDVTVHGAASPQRRINAGHVDEATVVLRMERMQDDLRRHAPDVAALVGTIPHVNRTDRARDHAPFYDAWSRAAVERAHRDDIDRFGYAFGADDVLDRGPAHVGGKP